MTDFQLIERQRHSHDTIHTTRASYHSNVSDHVRSLAHRVTLMLMPVFGSAGIGDRLP